MELKYIILSILLIKINVVICSCPQIIPILTTLTYFSCEKMQVSQQERGVNFLSDYSTNIFKITTTGWYRLIGKMNQDYLLIQSRNSNDQNIIKIVYNPIKMQIECQIFNNILSPKDISQYLKIYLQDKWFFIRIGINLLDQINQQSYIYYTIFYEEKSYITQDLVTNSKISKFDNNNFEYFFGSKSYYPQSRSCAVSKQVIAFLGQANDSSQGPIQEISQFEMFLLPIQKLQLNFLMASQKDFIYNLKDSQTTCFYKYNIKYPYYDFTPESFFYLCNIIDLQELSGIIIAFDLKVSQNDQYASDGIITLASFCNIDNTREKFVQWYSLGINQNSILYDNFFNKQGQTYQGFQYKLEENKWHKIAIFIQNKFNQINRLFYLDGSLISTQNLYNIISYQQMYLYLKNQSLIGQQTKRSIQFGVLKVYYGGLIQECDYCGLKINNQDCLFCKSSNNYLQQGQYFTCNQSCDYPFNNLSDSISLTCSFISQGKCDEKTGLDKFFSTNCSCPKSQYFDMQQNLCLNCLNYCDSCQNGNSCFPNHPNSYKVIGIQSPLFPNSNHLCGSIGQNNWIIKDQTTSIKLNAVINYILDEVELQTPYNFNFPQFYDIMLGNQINSYPDINLFYSGLQVFTGGFYYINQNNEDPCFLYINRQNFTCIYPKQGYALKNGVLISPNDCNKNIQLNQPLYYYNKYTMMCQNSGITLPYCLNIDISNKKCTQCIDSQMDLQNNCSCPNGMFLEKYSLMCRKCSSQCKSCSIKEDNCLLCQGNNKTPPSCDCSLPNYYQDTNQNCQECASQCKSCSQNQSFCLSCSEGRINPPLCYCNPILYTNSYSDPITNECKKKNCPYKCLVCDHNNQCFQCRGDRALPYCLCQQGYYDDPFNQLEFCQKCEIGLNFDENQQRCIGVQSLIIHNEKLDISSQLTNTIDKNLEQYYQQSQPQNLIPNEGYEYQTSNSIIPQRLFHNSIQAQGISSNPEQKNNSLQQQQQMQQLNPQIQQIEIEKQQYNQQLKYLDMLQQQLHQHQLTLNGQYRGVDDDVKLFIDQLSASQLLKQQQLQNQQQQLLQQNQYEQLMDPQQQNDLYNQQQQINNSKMYNSLRQSNSSSAAAQSNKNYFTVNLIHEQVKKFQEKLNSENSKTQQQQSQSSKKSQDHAQRQNNQEIKQNEAGYQAQVNENQEIQNHQGQLNAQNQLLILQQQTPKYIYLNLDSLNSTHKKGSKNPATSKSANNQKKIATPIKQTNKNQQISNKKASQLSLSQNRHIQESQKSISNRNSDHNLINPPPSKISSTATPLNEKQDNKKSDEIKEEFLNQQKLKILNNSNEKKKVVNSIFDSKKSYLDVRSSKGKEIAKQQAQQQQIKQYLEQNIQIYSQNIYHNIDNLQQVNDIYGLNQNQNQTVDNQANAQKLFEQRQQQELLQKNIQNHIQIQNQVSQKTNLSNRKPTQTMKASKSLPQFISQESLMNSAKERQNLEFISKADKTMEIRSKDNSFAASSSHFQSKIASPYQVSTVLNKHNQSTLSQFGQTNYFGIMTSPKTKLGESQFYNKQSILERNDFCLKHTGTHKKLLNLHYISEEMKECSFSSSFFTNNMNKKCAIKHQNQTARVQQSLNPTVHKQAAQMKSSYSRLHNFKKEMGFIYEVQNQYHQQENISIKNN
ncbi:hypothetical protein ABPG72_020148 [Tetrahymena utriculariae]